MLTTFHSMTSTNIFIVSHGYQIKSSDDWFLKMANRGVDEFGELMEPDAFMVNYFPFRKSLAFFLYCELISHSQIYSLLASRLGMEAKGSKVQRAL